MNSLPELTLTTTDRQPTPVLRSETTNTGRRWCTFPRPIRCLNGLNSVVLLGSTGLGVGAFFLGKTTTMIIGGPVLALIVDIAICTNCIAVNKFFPQHTLATSINKETKVTEQLDVVMNQGESLMNRQTQALNNIQVTIASGEELTQQQNTTITSQTQQIGSATRNIQQSTQFIRTYSQSNLNSPKNNLAELSQELKRLKEENKNLNENIKSLKEQIVKLESASKSAEKQSDDIKTSANFLSVHNLHVRRLSEQLSEQTPLITATREEILGLQDELSRRTEIEREQLVKIKELTAEVKKLKESNVKILEELENLADGESDDETGDPA